MKSPFNFFSVVFLLFVTSFPLLSQSIEDLEGTWMGSYTCRQGETGMRMRIQVQTDSSFVGTFEFFLILQGNLILANQSVLILIIGFLNLMDGRMSIKLEL
jgi:hypothetical protein